MLYKLVVKNGAVGKGLTHAKNILIENKHSKGTKKEELIYKKSGNMPSFGEKDPKEFWNAADVYEVNRRPYKEYEISLPNELTLEENKQIVGEFVKKIIGKDYPYTYAIHNKTNNREGGNTHVHLMFSERKFDGIKRGKETFFKRANTKNPEKGGAKKDRIWLKKETLFHHRKLLVDIINNSFKKVGLQQRISHLNLENRLIKVLLNNDPETNNLFLNNRIISLIKLQIKRKPKNLNLDLVLKQRIKDLENLKHSSTKNNEYRNKLNLIKSIYQKKLNDSLRN